jgi:ribosome maturation protein Sdo1
LENYKGSVATTKRELKKISKTSKSSNPGRTVLKLGMNKFIEKKRKELQEKNKADMAKGFRTMIQRK